MKHQLVNSIIIEHHVAIMNDLTDLFDFTFPEELIAQCSVRPRDSSRLMVLDKKTRSIDEKLFFNLSDELNSGDVLVLNNTKVFRARMYAAAKNREFEVFLLRPRRSVEHESEWDVLIQPLRKLSVGSVMSFAGMSGVLKAVQEDGVATVVFDMTQDDVIDFVNENGHIPIPPYIENNITNLDEYQTIYAVKTGSVAAPTAGFHFTESLLDTLKEKGVQLEYITLHVGMGTFMPMKFKTVSEHKMHAEYVTIKQEVAERILLAKKEGRRVIAVGTTVVRALEGVDKNVGLSGYSGDVDVFIKSGFKFNIVDALITNFHLPKSTLLVLVSAFAGRESILDAYNHAIDKKYRFFSFGDAMFIK
jgi:S-adenosylmethionine:tRNA ribosyltransferase-isomerase